VIISTQPELSDRTQFSSSVRRSSPGPR